MSSAFLQESFSHEASEIHLFTEHTWLHTQFQPLRAPYHPLPQVCPLVFLREARNKGD